MHVECLKDSCRHVRARHHGCLVFHACRNPAAHARAPPARFGMSCREGCCSRSQRKGRLARESRQDGSHQSNWRVMSRRAVRRALSEQTGEAAKATAPVTVPDPEAERPESPDAAAPRVSNVFSLLAEEENGDMSDAADETSERQQATSESAPHTPPPEPPASEKPKWHRHRRRRRRRPAHAQQKGNGGANEEPDVADVVRSSADETASSPLPPDRTEHSPVWRPLFAVDRRQLRPDTELMRKFGKRAVHAERHEAHDPSTIINGSARHRTPRITRSLFVTPQRHWPAYAPGLHMETESADADHSFRYVHAPAYAALQAEFALRAETLDPALLVELLAAHPYHVDTLLQVGEMYRAAGELDHTGECVQRALLVLEQAFHRRFVLGESQLPFACAENRSLPPHRHGAEQGASVAQQRAGGRGVAWCCYRGGIGGVAARSHRRVARAGRVCAVGQGVALDSAGDRLGDAVLSATLSQLAVLASAGVETGAGGSAPIGGGGAACGHATTSAGGAGAVGSAGGGGGANAFGVAAYGTRVCPARGAHLAGSGRVALVETAM
eukprot:ctg_1236.g389